MIPAGLLVDQAKKVDPGRREALVQDTTYRARGVGSSGFYGLSSALGENKGELDTVDGR